MSEELFSLINQKSVGILTEIELITEQNFELVNEIYWQTSMGFTIENNEITGLGLYQCNLSEFPNNLTKLLNLSWLCLGENRIKEIPEEIGNLKNLEKLWLWDNNIDALPNSIGYLNSLKELYLRNNRLTKIPDLN